MSCTSWINLHTRIETLSTQNRNILHQIQQRKNHNVIIAYDYEVRFNLSDESDDKDEIADCNKVTKPWRIISTPKKSDVITALDKWKYEDVLLEHDGLMLDSYIDLNLSTFKDLERLVDITSNIGEKYVKFFNEQSDEALKAFQIMTRNLQKLRDLLDELNKFSNDTLENIASDDDVKQNMDQMMMSFTKVYEKFNLKKEDQNLVVKFELKRPSNTDDIPSLVDIRDITKLRCVHTLKTHTGNVEDIKIFEILDEKFMASTFNFNRRGINENTIQIHRLSDKRLVATLTGHTSWIHSLALYKNTDGKQCLVSSSRDGTVWLWDLHENKSIVTLPNPSSYSSRGLVTFKKNNRYFIACEYNNGDIKIFDSHLHTEVTTLIGNGIVALTVFEKDGEKFLVSGRYGDKSKVWNLKDYTLFKSIDAQYVQCLTNFEFKGKVYIAGGGNGDVKVWDTEDFSLISTFTIGYVYYSLKACEYNGSVVSGTSNFNS